MSSHDLEKGRTFKVRGTEILATDSPQSYREKLARIALDEMYQFVAVLDTKGVLLEVNRAALEGAGLKLADVEGKAFWDCFWWGVSKESQETLKAAVARAAQGEFIRYDVEVFGRAGGKETIIIDFSMIPVKDEHGRVVYIVPEGRDITEKKAREREIAQKNADLQALLERIRELDEIKTQFFANVSHELRTPLALIIGPAERLSSTSAMSTAQRRESAQVITRNAKMLLKHVNDLLDMSKLEAGKLTIELKSTDLAALLRVTAGNFDGLADERKIDYQVEAAENWVVAIDPEKIQRSIMNLLSNAFKFVPDGGKIRCGLQANPAGTLLFVEDSGPGVRPELRKTIFERFRQGDGGANREFGGTGLGLAIAKEFVEAHKGNIQVGDSELGGALFQVLLPIRRLSLVEPRFDTGYEPNKGIIEGMIAELRPSPRLAGLSPQARDENTRILIVEDNVEMNRFISECLSADFHVISAFDGQEGLEMAASSRPNLIISDIMMPKVSGAEMIAELRNRPELANIPVLILSAKADDELRLRLLAEGAHDFIVKPFCERDLLIRVRNAIALQRIEQDLRAANMEAKRANKAKDEFLAMISHELRTPLTAILGWIRLLMAPQLTPDKAVHGLQIIERNVRLQGQLIEDLMDVSRIKTGKLSLTLGPVDFSQVISAAIESVSAAAEARDIRIERTEDGELPIILGDATRLQQVMWNLLSNAIKFTAKGGLVNINVVRSELSLRVRVEDNGRGIAADFLPRVFEQFRQAEGVAGSESGLGLGLAIVRYLVEQHGGNIYAESEGEGKGAAFVFDLPVREPLA